MRFIPWLTAALCAAPIWGLAQNCTSPNTDDDYILGDAGGTASAMHWPTGLVWKRCIEGETFGGGQCSTGGALLKSWSDWAETEHRLPQSFFGQANRGISSAFDQNLLQSGAWRMAYVRELEKLTENCGNTPKLNRSVFPDAPPSDVWSGSPFAADTSYAWYMWFDWGGGNADNRFVVKHARLVRGGQSFAALTAPPAQGAAASAQATFAALTLAASMAPGEAWGGARISGGGSPEFQVNGGGWVQEAIVQSGDQITVRLTAPAALGSGHTATLTLRSGQTTGTGPSAFNGGNESTAVQETTADFTLNAVSAPAAPQLDAASMTTGAAQPAITGSAEPGSTVEVFDGAASLGTAAADGATGAWSFTPAAPLSTGPHTVTATASSAAGTSAPSTPLALDVALFLGPVGSTQVTITSDINGCTLGSPPAFAPAIPADALPANATAPQGLLRFTAANCTGGTLTVQVTYPGSLAGLAPYKFGPASTGATAGWFPHGTASGSTVTYTVTDNGTGDNDTAPGVISDPHALFALAAPGGVQAIPTLGEWALALLSLLLVAVVGEGADGFRVFQGSSAYGASAGSYQNHITARRCSATCAPSRRAPGKCAPPSPAPGRPWWRGRAGAGSRPRIRR